MKFKKILKAAVCVALCLAMLSGTGVFAAIGTSDGSSSSAEPWDKNYNPTNIGMMPFTPEDGYVAQQNPPSFKWGNVDGATSYEVVVAADPELKDIRYRKDGIKYNYYNFDTTFETGVHYYWAVRYYKGDNPSSWSKVRKFRIDPDAYQYAFPDIETIKNRIPKGHPRLLATAETLEAFRAKKDKSEAAKQVYDRAIAQADQYILTEIDKEPADESKTIADPVKRQEWLMGLRRKTKPILDKAVGCAFAYLLTGDEKYGRYSIDCLLEASTWDINGVTSYETQDQIHREFAFWTAVAYDWDYSMMTDSEKEAVLKMISDRTEVMEYLLESLKKSPYDSHGYTAYGYIGVVALATVGNIPKAETWLEKTIIGFSALTPVWGYEDGWSQGVAYWSYDPPSVDWFMPFLAATGYANLYGLAYSQNQYLYYMYNNPPGSWGGFGDESGRTLHDSACLKISSYDSYFTKNPVTRWLAEQYGYVPGLSKSLNWFDYLIADDDTKPEEPVTYQLSHEFQDIGWVSMMDSIKDKDRIKLMFKSSPFGSYNHSHPDQNSFLLEAYGQPLLVNSGYYDSYHSAHDSGFTRRTGAHNCVTIADSIGQRDDDFSAKGHLTGYLTQQDFDLASGNATEAYKGEIGNFERNIIYIRPDIFVIVDDLKAAEKNKTSQFEWWLNSRVPISLYKDGNGARIENSGAVVDATVQYPQKVKSYYNNMNALSDMVEINPGGRYASSAVDTRVWFETEDTAATKMIVTLDVHRSAKEARFVDTEYNKSYVKMTFEDGTIMYVNLGDNDKEVVTKEGISFTGALVVMNGESIMLSGGTNLKIGGKDIVVLERQGSVVLGVNELSISTYSDNRISVNTDNEYIQGIEKINDYNGRELRTEIGITYESGKLEKGTSGEEVKADDSKKIETKNKNGDKKASETEQKPVFNVVPKDKYITFTAEKDNYQLMLNGKTINTDKHEATATVKIDGEEKTVKLEGIMGRNGKIKYSGIFDGEDDKYKCVGISDNLDASAVGKDKVSVIGKLSLSAQTDKDLWLELTRVPINKPEAEAIDDYDMLKDKLTVFKEGEECEKPLATGAEIYGNRPFLSGALGISGFNDPKTEMVYKVEIPEEGDYDFAVKYVAWEEGGAVRSFTINDVTYVYTLHKTVDYGTVPENWKAMLVKSGIHLQAGVYELRMGVLSGSWNYDWFGFVKK